MIKIQAVEEYIDHIAPFSSALSFDNVGLLVGSAQEEVERILVALDITIPVVEEAKRLKAQLIVSHHPVIFQPLKRLSANSVPYRLAQAGIAAICAHTNLDMAPQGVNDTLAQKLGLKNIQCLAEAAREPFWKVVVFVPVNDANRVSQAMTEAGAGEWNRYRGCTFSVQGTGTFVPMEGARPAIGFVGEKEEVQECRIEMLCRPECLSAVIQAMRDAHPYEEPAFDLFEDFGAKKRLASAIAGELPEAMPPERFAEHVKKCLQCEGVRFIAGNRNVRTVGLCSGAGGEMVFDAIGQGIDAYVTGEIKHHELLAAAQSGITVVDAGHFKTENIIVKQLAILLKSQFPQLQIEESACCTDGVQYL